MAYVDKINAGGELRDIHDTAGRQMIAPIELTSTATAAHAKGEYFIYNDTLYEATSAIAVGGTITPNTNCTAIPDGVSNEFGGDISQLKSAISDHLVSDEIKTALLACFQNVAWATPNGQDLYSTLAYMLNPPANLSYITAVYTQTITVMDNDPLNVIRPELTVTAHYTDGTSSVVSGYILSGTFTPGTSVLTVNYATKTASISVVVTPSYAVPGRTYALTDVGLWHMNYAISFAGQNANKLYNDLLRPSTYNRSMTSLIPIAQTGIKLSWNASVYKIVPTGWDAGTRYKYYAFQPSVQYITVSPASYSESTITGSALKYLAVVFGRIDDAELSTSDLSALNLQLEVL